MALEDLQFIIDYVRGEGRVIRKAPAAFLTAVLVATCITTFVVYEFVAHSYSREVASLRGAHIQLEATIKSLEGTIKYQDSRISEFSGRPQPERQVGSSRVQLTNIALLTPDDPKYVNYYFKNSGSAPAIGIRHGHIAFGANAEIAANDLEAIFAQVNMTMADVKKRNVESELQQNESVFYTEILTLKDTSGKDINNRDLIESGQLLYLVQVVLWKDLNTPPGKWRALESCMYISKERSLHKCDTHNRIFISD